MSQSDLVQERSIKIPEETYGQVIEGFGSVNEYNEAFLYALRSGAVILTGEKGMQRYVRVQDVTPETSSVHFVEDGLSEWDPIESYLRKHPEVGMRSRLKLKHKKDEGTFKDLADNLSITLEDRGYLVQNIEVFALSSGLVCAAILFKCVDTSGRKNKTKTRFIRARQPHELVTVAGSADLNVPQNGHGRGASGRAARRTVAG
jgi:hypothetical protein